MYHIIGGVKKIGGVDGDRGYENVETGHICKVSVLSTHFCCKLEIILKVKY